MLTPAQLSAVKADILANPDLNAFPNNTDGAFAIAGLYNLQASPDFWVWRTYVTKSEIVNNVGPNATTFNWVANGFHTRSVADQTMWRELFGASDSVNPALANVRWAFTYIFSGTGIAANNLAHILDLSKRKATRIEQVLSNGTGSLGSPATMEFEGVISYPDVDAARNS